MQALYIGIFSSIAVDALDEYNGSNETRRKSIKDLQLSPASVRFFYIPLKMPLGSQV
jgi:hypothetical protein